jgi:hypothetical protein
MTSDSVTKKKKKNVKQKLKSILHIDRLIYRYKGSFYVKN